MQTSFFCSKFDIQSASVTLKMRSRSTKSNHFFSHVPMVFLSKFVQNPPFVSEDRVQTRLIFSLYSVVILKIMLTSSKSNQVFKLSQQYSIFSLARIRYLVQEIGCRCAFFGQNLKISSAGVTLKMRSRSPKSNHFFPPPNNVSVQVWSKSIHWFRTSGFP